MKPVEVSFDDWRMKHIQEAFEYGPFRVQRTGQQYLLVVVYPERGAHLVGAFAWRQLCRRLKIRQPRMLWGSYVPQRKARKPLRQVS